MMYCETECDGSDNSNDIVMVRSSCISSDGGGAGVVVVVVVVVVVAAAAVVVVVVVAAASAICNKLRIARRTVIMTRVIQSCDYAWAQRPNPWPT